MIIYQYSVALTEHAGKQEANCEFHRWWRYIETTIIGMSRVTFQRLIF